MSLDSRIRALEDKAKPDRMLVVWECNGETVEDAERREGIGPDDYGIILVVKYENQELENAKTTESK